jgi:hypothetical protein
VITVLQAGQRIAAAPGGIRNVARQPGQDMVSDTTTPSMQARRRGESLQDDKVKVRPMATRTSKGKSTPGRRSDVCNGWRDSLPTQLEFGMRREITVLREPQENRADCDEYTTFVN